MKKRLEISPRLHECLRLSFHGKNLIKVKKDEREKTKYFLLNLMEFGILSLMFIKILFVNSWQKKYKC